MRVILCGPPMCGKSYFGRKLAQLLHWEFIDTDLQIEARYQQSKGTSLCCREIANTIGTTAFHALEQQVINSLEEGEKHQIISIGGGALQRAGNAEKLKQIGHLIYLETAPALLLARLAHKIDLPSYLDPAQPSESLLRLLEKRTGSYEKYADFILSIGEESEKEVLQLLSDYITLLKKET